jgi:hypothetical protein
MLNQDYRADDNLICLPISFVLWTSFVSARIALNWLWHLSSRTPLMRCLHCPRRSQPRLYLQKSLLILPTVPNTLRFPSFWSPQGCILKMPLCGLWQAERQSSDSPAKSFTWPAYSVWGKSWKVLTTKENLWKNGVNFVKVIVSKEKAPLYS